MNSLKNILIKQANIFYVMYYLTKDIKNDQGTSTVLH